jgi:hypothetical protein
MMLREGELDGVRVFKAETVKLMTDVQSPAAVRARARGVSAGTSTPPTPAHAVSGSP